jgi:hypothetical protein
MIIRSLLVLGLVAILALGNSTTARSETPRYDLSRSGTVIHGGPATPAKTVGDTINLMATRNDPTNGTGEPTYFGDFETAGGGPDWNGWTSVDHTLPTESHWNVSNHLEADPLNMVAWCGDINIPSCIENDPVGGYGNSWYDILEFRKAVPHPSETTLAILTGLLHVDMEPGYDTLTLSVKNTDHQFTNINFWSDSGYYYDDRFDIQETITFLPADYENGSEVALYFRFKSDGGRSDQDCSWPTTFGAVRLDDVAVQLINGPSTLDYFTDFQDGTLGDWTPVFPGVGDFAQIWTGLVDLDPCADNFTSQAAFIDDGLVVPGTGGSECINWCYGPGGFIVNTTGGFLGTPYYSRNYLNNSIQSPVMVWPDDALDGARLSFDVYVHEDLTADAPGVFYLWGVRSADTDDSAGNGAQAIENMPWLDYNFVLFGGPEYRRHEEDVTDLMNPGRDEVQVKLLTVELGWVWGWTGNDGYPAPYFDNVKFQVHDVDGPAMHAREIDLANDGFPERGSIDFQDLGSMNVRFDMARNISPASHQRLDFGDSIFVEINSVRSGAQLHGVPELHYRLWPNPVFDPHRSAGLPLEGSVPGFTPPTVMEALETGTALAVPSAYWAFDLPDTGFLFPGDVLHYYLAGPGQCWWGRHPDRPDARRHDGLRFRSCGPPGLRPDLHRKSPADNPR